MLKVKTLQVKLGFRPGDLKFVLLLAHLSRKRLLIFLLFSCGKVNISVSFLDLLEKLLLLISYLFHNFKALIVAHFEIALIAYELLTLVRFREPPLVLAAPVTHRAAASFAVMTAFLHDPSEFLGQGFVTRKTFFRAL